VEPPIFTMLGQVANGMTYDACIALLRAIAPDVVCVYGSVTSASAGVGACMWEASDAYIMSVTVRPARDGA
jgi:hypothetical protein